MNEMNGSVVIFGSRSEVEIANEIVTTLGPRHTYNGLRAAGCGQRVLMMSGKTGLRELAALISECDAFITNDSGPMHMAAALFIPTVAIFGSTNRDATGPFGQGHKIISRDLSCSPCMKRECPEKHLECMTEITAGEVFSALNELLLQERAVFLDRDGTIIEDSNYLNTFDELVIFPGAEESMQTLKETGFKLIGITNQSGIARKIIDEDFIIKSNAYLKDKLGIDDFFYCPHHPDEHCPCRKPEPMLALMAKIKHGINPKASYVIGDKESDVLLAKKIGATGILLSPDPLSEGTSASYTARNLNEAAKWIVEREHT